MIDRRILFDVNVLVSAAMWLGKPWLAYERASLETLLTTDLIMLELESVIMRPKFDGIASVEKRQLFVCKHRLLCEIVIGTTRIQACRDPKDDMYLEAAVSGSADIIVTGDQDLLVLDPFQGVRIVTPAEFLTL